MRGGAEMSFANEQNFVMRDGSIGVKEDDIQIAFQETAVMGVEDTYDTEESDKTIWCFTGYKYENLLKNPKQLELLKLIDVLVDGPFMKDLRDEDLFFRGSSNQRLINVKKSLETGKVVELHLTKENPIPDL